MRCILLHVPVLYTQPPCGSGCATLCCSLHHVVLLVSEMKVGTELHVSNYIFLIFAFQGLFSCLALRFDGWFAVTGDFD